MKKIIIISSVLLSASLLGKAQTTTPNVVATSGDFYTSVAGSLSWTLGEVSVETFTAGNTILTQGFQQPVNLFTTGIGSAQIVSSISAYPNPVLNTLNLDFNKNVSGNVKVEVFDMKGTLVYAETLVATAKENSMKLNFLEYAPGIYLLKFSDSSNKDPQTIKIFKTN